MTGVALLWAAFAALVLLRAAPAALVAPLRTARTLIRRARARAPSADLTDMETT